MGLTNLDMVTNADLLMVRSDSLCGFKESVAESGHDPLVFLRMAGLPSECLYEDELRIPLAASIRLLDITARLTRIDDLGLRMAARRSYATSGPLGLLLREQSTIREVIIAITDYAGLQVEGLIVSIDEADEIVVMSIDYITPSGVDVRQTIELTVGFFNGLIRYLMRQDWRPEMVTFRHKRPASVRLHAQFFGSVPLFEQDQNAIVLLKSDMQVRLPQSEPYAAKHIAQYMKMIYGIPQQNLRGKVRQLIVIAVPQQLGQMDWIARQLDISPRTLHRLLKNENTTFKELLNEVRLETMKAHLESETKSLTEISELLGFSSLSAFSRWKRKTLATDE